MTGSEGKGIQLESGELIIPLYDNNNGQGLCKSADHGKTWQHGGLAAPPTLPSGGPAFQGPYEGEIVELFEKTAAGTPRLMYDVRIATLHDYCAVLSCLNNFL
jgi:hypothetical protein